MRTALPETASSGSEGSVQGEMTAQKPRGQGNKIGEPERRLADQDAEHRANQRHQQHEKHQQQQQEGNEWTLRSGANAQLMVKTLTNHGTSNQGFRAASLVRETSSDGSDSTEPRSARTARLRTAFQRVCKEKGLSVPRDAMHGLQVLQENEPTLVLKESTSVNAAVLKCLCQIPSSINELRAGPLVALDLYRCQMGVEEFSALGEALVQNQDLISVTLDGCVKRDRVIDAFDGLATPLEASLRPTVLQNLIIKDCALTVGRNMPLRTLAKRILPCLTNLKTLALPSCELDDSAVEELAAAILRGPSRSFLNKLDLTANDFGARGGQAVSLLLEQRVPLLDLHLADNKIGSQGFDTIVTAAHRTNSLCVLDVSRNELPAIAAIRSLAEYLEDPQCTLESLYMQDCSTSIDSRCIEILGAALGTNNSLKKLDLQNSRLPSTCTGASLGMFAESLGSNSSMTSVEFGKFDDRVLSAAEAREALVPLRRILMLNSKLSVLLSKRRVSKSPSVASSVATQELISREKALSQQRVLLLHGDSASESSAHCALSPISRISQTIPSPIASSPIAATSNVLERAGTSRRSSRAASKEMQQMVQELKSALRAVRTRTQRHHTEIESRLSGRLFELDSRVSAMVDGPGSFSTRLNEGRREGFAAKRIEVVETRLRKASEQTVRLGRFASSLRDQVDGMSDTLRQQQQQQFDRDTSYGIASGALVGASSKNVAYGQRSQPGVRPEILDLVEQKFGEAEQDVAQLQRNFVHDFDKKQEIWRERLEKQLGQVVERIGLLEQSVLTMHDENIFTLESLLKDRKHRSRQAR